MQQEASYAAIFAQNFARYDFIIFIVALVTVLSVVLTVRYAKRLFTLTNHTVYLPEKDSSAIVESAVAAVREYDVVQLRRKMLFGYNAFATLIVIFPLLGILGTVISLLPMTAQMGTAQMQSNFFLALTSTFWGLVFAIIFKLVDGWLSGQVEDNENTVRLYLERNAGQDHVA